MEFNDKHHRNAHTMMVLNYAGGVISGVRLPYLISFLFCWEGRVGILHQNWARMLGTAMGQTHSQGKLSEGGRGKKEGIGRARKLAKLWSWHT